MRHPASITVLCRSASSVLLLTVAACSSPAPIAASPDLSVFDVTDLAVPTAGPPDLQGAPDLAPLCRTPKDCGGSPQACCNGACANISSDGKNCGSCGNVCGAGKACCNGNCTDLTADRFNCGACGTACASINASPSCFASACSEGTCAAKWADCNNDPKDGCETRLDVDIKNCLQCGTVCALANAVAGCADGGCYLKACQFGWDNCNGDDTDGCEISVTRDPKNCGSCGKDCNNPPPAHGKATCGLAQCQIVSCDNGFLDCDGLEPNGCETSTAFDANNCGACANKCGQGLICKNGGCTCPNCAIPNASAKCVNNICIFDKCNPGWADCDGQAKNGCETDITSDANNCNGCGKVCPKNQATCSNSMCIAEDLSGVFNQFVSEGRNVYLWKTTPCVDLGTMTNFCTARGLNWWRPKSAQDAQTLITNAFNIDMFHTWIQVYGLQTGLGTVGGYPVTVDGAGCEQAADGTGFGAFRKWACSFCNPPSNARDQNDNQSCCWDKTHQYDWFVCE